MTTGPGAGRNFIKHHLNFVNRYSLASAVCASIEALYGPTSPCTFTKATSIE